MWRIIIVRYSAEILAALMLLIAVFFIYRLAKDDSGPLWNIFLIATSFLAISAIFDIIEELYIFETFEIIDSIFMMLSGIVFASGLAFASVRYKYLKVKK